jgi:F-type H+-transporting ATPase subunit delta
MAKNKFVIAKRYARALWEHAGSEKEAEACLPALQTLSRAVAESKELERLFRSSEFSSKEKLGVVTDLLAKTDAPEKLKKFVNYLGEARRLDVLVDIERSFTSMVLKSKGMIEAVVESAGPLSEAQLRQVTTQIEGMTGKKTLVTLRENAELLAGIRIHVDGKTIDASLKANMARLEKQMLKTAIAEA